MRELKREANTPKFVPDYMAKSIEDIDFKKLAKIGVKYIAFDADSTLVPYRGIELSAQTKRFLRVQKKLFKEWCIASNRITNDLGGLSMGISAPIVKATITNRKPRRQYFKRVLKNLGAQPEQTAMIGDKLIADMWGAKRAGFVTVWVEHLGQDNWLDRFRRLRQMERRLLKKFI